VEAPRKGNAGPLRSGDATGKRKPRPGNFSEPEPPFSFSFQSATGFQSIPDDQAPVIIEPLAGLWEGQDETKSSASFDKVLRHGPGDIRALPEHLFVSGPKFQSPVPGQPDIGRIVEGQPCIDRHTENFRTSRILCTSVRSSETFAKAIFASSSDSFPNFTSFHATFPAS